jgi:Rps23 Pro-64 3,4-dihydroxylase Tpa1-like proline 4-hydroxylase
MTNAAQETLDRTAIADAIAACLAQHRDGLQRDFALPDRVPSCHVDGLLPEDMAHAIHAQFPATDAMAFKNTLRERKYVSAQMDRHAAIIEEAVYAFQDARVVRLIGEITGMQGLEPDTNLYAGGISAMPQGNYLRPHLDNSHDKDQGRYRALNLLYYVTPDWREEYGGNFELWDEGPKGEPRTIVSRFNRLVLMATNRHSWHSVSEVLHPQARCCVSNYYFSAYSPEQQDYFHATSFRGRPQETATDALLRTDNALRTALLKVFGSRVFKNPHVYKRSDPPG